MTKKTEKRKQSILESALKLFSKHGYFNTSVRKIARDAEISDGLLYSYFKSKEDLAFGVLQSAFKTLDDTISYEQNLSAQENIKLSITKFIDLIINQEEKIRLLALMGFQKEKFAILNEITEKKYNESVNKFEKQFIALGCKNSKTEAQFLVAILDGLVFETLLMDNAINLEEAKNNLIKKYCGDENS